ncbi:unnamed protein product [Clonostachys byssicola]|uniref:Uncharacterized protein n=1 Tax=Clonostachys byssicola TaxID=160290 RepID=A0A9N9UFD5_9HYPO|nr:unnamed protein product [Clonostachys byssicola]
MTRSSRRPRHVVEGAVQAEAQARHFEPDLRKLDDQELVRLGQVRCLSCRTEGQLQAPMDELGLDALEEGQPEGLLEASPRQVVALPVATWSGPLAGEEEEEDEDDDDDEYELADESDECDDLRPIVSLLAIEIWSMATG